MIIEKTEYALKISLTSVGHLDCDILLPLSDNHLNGRKGGCIMYPAIWIVMVF